MEYQKIANLLDNASNQPLNLGQETELKQMMINGEHILVIKLNFKL